jgi:hypothetical protein
MCDSSAGWVGVHGWAGIALACFRATTLVETYYLLEN